MKVAVRHEFTNSMRFRLTFRFRLPCTNLCVEYVRSEQWDKKTATEALDLLQYVYGINRRNVRFHHI